jgi:hypothetical protein
METVGKPAKKIMPGDKMVKNFALKIHLQFRIVCKRCGDGDIAEIRDHLGVFRETGGDETGTSFPLIPLHFHSDMCCSDHDLCPQYIASNETSSRSPAPLANSERQFFDCLKASKVLLSVGSIYSNILGGQCFGDDPAKCKNRSKGRCVNYEFDLAKAKQNQWFDNTIY